MYQCERCESIFLFPKRRPIRGDDVCPVCYHARIKIFDEWFINVDDDREDDDNEN